MQQPTPPRWINRLLERICDPHRLEGIQGDLEEIYARRLEQYSPRRAQWGYVLDAIGFLRPFSWKKREESSLNHR